MARCYPAPSLRKPTLALTQGAKFKRGSAAVSAPPHQSVAPHQNTNNDPTLLVLESCAQFGNDGVDGAERIMIH